MLDLDQSPLASIFGSLQNAPFELAPECKDELRLLVARTGIKVRLDLEEESFCLSVDPETKQITFGLATAERLWAACYGYVVLIGVIQKHGMGILIHLSADESSRRAMELLEWSVKAGITGKYVPWPSDLPKPSASDAHGCDEYAASELYLCMVGWAILHEIGHLACSHRASHSQLECIRMEYEADDWASQWILEKWKQYGDDSRIFIKRSLGMTLALSMFAGLEAHDRKGGLGTHPDSPERLLHFLDKFVPETHGSSLPPEQFAWFAAVVVVQLHLMATGKSCAPTAEFPDYRSFLVDASERLGSP